MPDEQVNQSGDQAQAGLGWRAALPDEYKENEFVKTFQKPGDFVKTAIEIKTDRDALKSQLENSIPKLKPDAKPEEREAYYKAIGRPEKPDDYKFDGIEGLDEGFMTEARPEFHKLGLTNDQAKSLLALEATIMKKRVDQLTIQRENERTEAEGKLKTEWGEKFPLKVEAIRRVWAKLSPKAEYDGFANETKLGNHPVFLRLMDAIATKFSEDNTPSGGSGGGEKKEGLISIYTP